MPALLKLTPEQEVIRELSEQIVLAQKPIQILDAVKWGPEVKEAFFKANAKQLPPVDNSYYQQHALPFDPDAKIAEFHAIERNIHRKLGQFSGIAAIMLHTCHEYRIAIEMLKLRGTEQFSQYSVDLYGSSMDAFYPGAPILNDLAELLATALTSLQQNLTSQKDEKKYTASEAAEILNERLASYFHNAENDVAVIESDSIISDAAAGASYIKMRTDAMFSERDIQLLEVHEGWVHVGTSLNGSAQPVCTFLGKGPPSATITQEGLAVITEIFTFSSYPSRVQRITNRIKAIYMAENGADFLEVYRYFCEQGVTPDNAYNLTTRVYRGSTPQFGPFTKDLSYAKGFLLIYNYIRLAVQMGLSTHVPILFTGKLRLEDVHTLYEYVEEGTVILPLFMPPQFKDLAALSSWMSFSLFLNQLDLKKLAENYRHILHH